MSWQSVRRLLAFVSIVGAVVIAFAGSALPVQAADLVTNGSFVPIINFDGQCLDMPSTASDTQAVVNPCSGQPRQQWAWLAVGNGGFLIQNERSRLCLTVRNHYTGVGGKVVQVGCVRSESFDQWDILPPTPDGVEIANIGDHGLVMHPAVCTSAIGAEIYMNVSNQCRVDFWHG